MFLNTSKMKKKHIAGVCAAMIAIALLGGCATQSARVKTPPATVQIPGAGEIVVIDPEHYDLSVKDALEQVRDQDFAAIVSIALVEVRKKYPQLKLEAIELKNFTHRKAAGGQSIRRGPAQGRVVIYFKDRSADCSIQREGKLLHWEQLYRVEFVLTSGLEAIFVQMSPPPPGLGGMLKDAGGQTNSDFPRPSSAMRPTG